MRNKLKEIQKKLNKQPISSLSKEEVEIYFDHRLQNLISSKKVLVKNELEYLLGETGPGNFRIEPDLFHLLTNEKSFAYPAFENIPEIKKIKDQKEKAENYIIKNINSDETQKLFIRILGNYLKKIKMVSTEPFLLEGIFDMVPVFCLIKNGEWVLPNAQLFSFLKLSQTHHRFPIIIAKKISGILFPVFRGLSIMGLNTYKVYLSKRGKKVIDAVKSGEELLSEIKYNNQFQFIDEVFAKEIIDESYEGELLKNFFEVVLKSNIDVYYKNFLQLKVRITDNFIDTVSQFRKNKATVGLIESYKNKQKLINDLGSVISST